MSTRGSRMIKDPVPNDAAKRHVDNLVADGATVRNIAHAAGISYQFLKNLGKHPYISSEREQAILAVTGYDVGPPQANDEVLERILAGETVTFDHETSIYGAKGVYMYELRKRGWSVPRIAMTLRSSTQFVDRQLALFDRDEQASKAAALGKELDAALIRERGWRSHAENLEAALSRVLHLAEPITQHDIRQALFPSPNLKAIETQ